MTSKELGYKDFWNHSDIVGSKWIRKPRNECEEKRIDYYRNIPIFKEGDS